MNRDLVGKEYPARTYRVTAQATTRYARSYNEDNPCFLDRDRPQGIVAPPVFGVVMAGRAVAQVVGDPQLNIDFPLALHGEQDMEFFAPVRPDDEITTRARIESIQTKLTGETLVVVLDLAGPEKRRVQRHRFTLFVRSRAAAAPSQGRPQHSDAVTRPEPQSVVHQTLDHDQTFRYAEASGDRTPIHLDEEVAKRAGLPGIIVHGLCTLAFVSKAVIDSLCGGDPTRLARLGVRFARPVLPGATIATHFWPATPRDKAHFHVAEDRLPYVFETYDPDARAVLRDGVCEVRA